jgi:hypothetical protein
MVRMASFGSLSLIALLVAISGCGSANPTKTTDGGPADGAAADGGTTVGSAGGDGSSSTGTGGDTTIGTGGVGGAGTAGAQGAAGMSGQGGTTGAAGVGGPGGSSGAGGASGTAGKGGTSGTDAGADAGPIVCRAQSSCSTEGETCEAPCVRGATTSCVCATPPGATKPEFLCAPVQCSSPDGGTADAGQDAGITTPACPANVTSRQTKCDPSADTLCETPCVNMLNHRCICNGAGTKGTWLCANNERMCM